jgi:hypothetical protein
LIYFYKKTSLFCLRSIRVEAFPLNTIRKTKG